MKKSIIIFIVLIILAVAGYLLFIGNKQFNQANTNEDSNLAGGTTLEGSGDDSMDTAAQYEIIYTDSGYSPSELTIKVGDTVTWKNQSSVEMWVASAMHPTHTLYSGTSLQEHCPDLDNNDFDQCKGVKSGESWSFTFDKKGTWKYHDHLTQGKFGSIVVE